MKSAKTYEKAGFRIQYPKKWKVKDAGAGYTAQFFTKRGDFESNLTVVIRDISDADPFPSLEEYTRASLENIKQFEEDAGDIQVADREFLGIPGKEVQYSGTSFTSDMFLTHLMWWTLKGSTEVLLNFSAQPEFFHEDVSIAREMIDSFELL